METWRLTTVFDGFNAHPDLAGGLARALAAVLLVIHSWHLQVEINPVEQGSGDAFLVVGDDRLGAGASPQFVAIIPAGAGV